MFKIILKKKKNSCAILLVQRHKIKDLLGLIINNKFIIDYPKIYNCLKRGYILSDTVSNLLYKELSNKNIKFKSLVY